MNTNTYDLTTAEHLTVFALGIIPVALVAGLAVQLVALYRSYAYRRILTDFMEGRYSDLQLRAEKLRKKLGPDRRGKMKQKYAYAYNNLCHVLASLALFDGDEDTFLDRISEVEFEEQYPMRAFTLALYYLAKGEREIAEEHYFDFKASPIQEDDMQAVLDHIFEPESVEEEDLYDALNRFRNPATLYLLEKAGLLSAEEEIEDE